MFDFLFINCPQIDLIGRPGLHDMVCPAAGCDKDRSDIRPADPVIMV